MLPLVWVVIRVNESFEDVDRWIRNGWLKMDVTGSPWIFSFLYMEVRGEKIYYLSVMFSSIILEEKWG